MPLGSKSALILLCLLWPAYGQTRLGRIVLQLQDESGAVLAGVEVHLASDQTHLSNSLRTGSSGEVVFRGLPFGTYRLLIEDGRFEPHMQTLVVSSEVSQSLSVRLRIRGPASQVSVSGVSPLVDPQKTNSSLYSGETQISQRLASLPNRDLVEMVASLPGWVLESNGVLHPRGSEYQTQYVFDGVPIFDNRSPGFSSAPFAEVAESFEVMTAGIPAEFGRKLGGVVNVASRAADEGRGVIQIYGGNHALVGGALQLGGNAGKLGYSAVASASHTSRYLDPPAVENFYNQANLASGFIRLDFAPDKEDVFRLFAWSNYAHLEVPNEIFQQEAGQQQTRLNRDQDLTLSWEHYYSSQAASTVAVYTRHLSADLHSNPLSTPLLTEQDREFSVHGANASFSRLFGAHQFKLGGDVILSPVQEFFSTAVTDASFFEQENGSAVPPGSQSIQDFTPENPFIFSKRRNSLDYSFFGQDQWRFRNLTFNLGLRYDGYRFLIHDQAWSPRFGVAYFISKTQTNFHFSYDRAFQTPTIENLLLTSSAEAQALSPLRAQGQEGGIPVPAGRAHFYEAGFSQEVGRRLRIDGHLFRRDLWNAEDDDVFFNTGVSFPITMNKASVKGAELRAELSRWHGLSGFASYSNLLGVAYTPVTGGLFLGEDIAVLLQPNLRFPISQDQRNTLQFRIHYQPDDRSRWWVAGGMRYESGLPVELEEGTTPEELQSSYPQVILDQVNFLRNRIRPHEVWDASTGFRLWSKERRLATLQLDLLNLTNRFYLINFEGLLSGTGLGLGRTAIVKLAFQF